MENTTKVLTRRRLFRKHIFLKGFVQKIHRVTGFTLVEMMVATCIFLMLVNMAFLTLNTGMNSWFSGGTSVELRSEIIKTFIAMEKELKATAPAQTNLPSGGMATSLIFHLPQDIDGDGTIVDWNGTAPLYKPAIEWSPTTVTYQLNANGEIIRTTSLGQSRIISRNIISLQFSRSSTVSNILQIDITAQKMDPKRRMLNDTARLIVKMRNN